MAEKEEIECTKRLLHGAAIDAAETDIPLKEALECVTAAYAQAALERDREYCALCDETMEAGNGDNWDDLCPGCADRVSEYIDKHGFSDDEQGRDAAIANILQREKK